MKHYHLIGIGGIGMSGIAKLLLRQANFVSGSDIKENKIIDELRDSGARIFIGHNAKNIEDADLVIYSSAIKEDNPELEQAHKKTIPILKRAQALAMLMQDKTVITVTGSHGKTTTSSLVSYMLLEAGLSPDIAVGGILKNIDSNAYLGGGKFFVAEADESDGSFLNYQPKYSIITNIDYEHLDYYKDFKNAISAFRQFMDRTDKNGCLFCCYEDTNLKGLLKDYKNKFMLFGLNKEAEIHPENIEFSGLSSEFDCFIKDKHIARFRLALGGAHNISNALAVIGLGCELGIEAAIIKKTLANYKGAGRRLESKFKSPDYQVIDDYAHHPTEIKATLSALKNLRSARIIAIFQPHRYSRMKLLFDEFTRSFELADQLIITDIYPAGEVPIEGVTAMNLCAKIKEQNPHKQINFLPKEEIVRHILKIIKPLDLIITLGAGDITRISDELAKELKKKN
jgi:UDP-N-acetylmuramate--alanine ligase